MGLTSKVKLDCGLHRQASARAAALGYASLDEFVEHLLEQELERHEEEVDNEQVLQRLQGLGYIE